MTRRELLAIGGGVAVSGRAAEPSARSAVALIQGEDRRKNVSAALAAIDDRIRERLKRKKYVLIKPNFVSVERQLAATHADAIRGILDYLAPRFKGPVVIAEAAREDTFQGYETFLYNRLLSEFRSQKVQLADLNEEAAFRPLQIVDPNLHFTPVRLAARLFDPEAFVICSAILKTHNYAVATLSVKNMAMGAPLHSRRKETEKWHDKRKYHAGHRQMHLNLALTAKALAPAWGACLIDGFEGMENDGPVTGTPVAHKVAIASADFIAADRVGVEAMGINSDWVGYLRYCAEAGLGRYDLAQIELRGNAKLEAVRKTYKLHSGIKSQLEWLGPLKPA
ncbi:MAG: DUF362 domain-containing protein [Acidobacteria bacterium]|nr:DUF362 domain-containing protein [Acidobacteriota bacterium]